MDGIRSGKSIWSIISWFQVLGLQRSALLTRMALVHPIESAQASKARSARTTYGSRHDLRLYAEQATISASSPVFELIV